MEYPGAGTALGARLRNPEGRGKSKACKVLIQVNIKTAPERSISRALLFIGCDQLSFRIVTEALTLDPGFDAGPFESVTEPPLELTMVISVGVALIVMIADP